MAEARRFATDPNVRAALHSPDSTLAPAAVQDFVSPHPPATVWVFESVRGARRLGAGPEAIVEERPLTHFKHGVSELRGLDDRVWYYATVAIDSAEGGPSGEVYPSSAAFALHRQPS